MAVSFKIIGLEKVHRGVLDLEPNIINKIDKAQNEFMAFVQKSAKIRAPHFSGQLAESIVFKQNKKGNWQLTVGSPYGWFQEHGFSIKKNEGFIYGDMPVEGGYRIIDWMMAKGIPGIRFRPTGIAHPFMRPALESGLNHLPDILRKAMLKAIKESVK